MESVKVSVRGVAKRHSDGTATCTITVLTCEQGLVRGRSVDGCVVVRPDDTVFANMALQPWLSPMHPPILQASFLELPIPSLPGYVPRAGSGMMRILQRRPPGHFGRKRGCHPLQRANGLCPKRTLPERRLGAVVHPAAQRGACD